MIKSVYFNSDFEYNNRGRRKAGVMPNPNIPLAGRQSQMWLSIFILLSRQSIS